KAATGAATQQRQPPARGRYQIRPPLSRSTWEDANTKSSSHPVSGLPPAVANASLPAADDVAAGSVRPKSQTSSLRNGWISGGPGRRRDRAPPVAALCRTSCSAALAETDPTGQRATRMRSGSGGTFRRPHGEEVVNIVLDSKHRSL